ncbi:family 53 glycosyl hydrolase [Bisporella sp. PMI_857]|nr:family 53 glycosyl hydrolase [Bisporella sp. PMI_857]
MYLWGAVCLALNVAVAASSRSSITGKPSSFFYKGHDLSSLKLLEDGGSIFKDTARYNETRSAEAILADGGMNTVRLRIWVNPADGVYGLKYNLDLAKRFQKQGFKLYLDFHFSDTWADPQKQFIPAAWPTALKPLASTLRAYVKDTLVSFQRAGIKLDIVSLGNELRHGLLWPTGRANVDVQPWPSTVANFSNAAILYKAARAGVDDAIQQGISKPQVMLHIDNGWNLTLQQRWYGALTANAVPLSAWDVFGVSFYPFYGTSATFNNLRTTLNTLARQYKKPIQVVETDYPAICNGQWNPIPESSEPSIPYNVDGQLIWVKEVIDIVRDIPNGLGQGVHYWEPAWLNNTSLGSACNDAILFDPDYSNPVQYVGYSRKSVNMFKENQ